MVGVRLSLLLRYNDSIQMSCIPTMEKISRCVANLHQVKETNSALHRENTDYLSRSRSDRVNRLRFLSLRENMR